MIEGSLECLSNNSEGNTLRIFNNIKEDNGMNLSKRKEELEREIASINKQIDACNHEYGECLYDPETVKVPYGSQIVKCGSDIYDMPEGYREEQQDRWSRTCKKCGHKIYSKRH